MTDSYALGNVYVCFSSDFAIIKNKTPKRKDNTTSFIAGGIAAVSIPSIGIGIYFAARRKKKKQQVSQVKNNTN